jgi:hypothetical protein
MAVDGRGVLAPIAARRAGPREHGRQAARSKRDRPERAGEETTPASHVHAGVAGALIP